MPCAPILGNREHYHPTQGSVCLDYGLRGDSKENKRWKKRETMRNTVKELKDWERQDTGCVKKEESKRKRRIKDERIVDPWFIRAAEPAVWHRRAAAHADIYSIHARLPFAGPRRPLASGFRVSPSSEPLNITILNHPQQLVCMCTKPSTCNNNINTIKHWIGGESERLQHSMSDVKSLVKQVRSISCYVNSLCSDLGRLNINYAIKWIFLLPF